jgi:hypothetical protein
LPDAVEAGELEERLVGLAAAVAEEDPAGPGVADEPAGQLGLVGVPEEVAGVDELAGLALDRLDPVGMAVPERADGDPEEKSR